jgi:excisionase family DNA binding protein
VGKLAAPSISSVTIVGDRVSLPKLAFRVDELVHVLGLGKTKIRELIDKGKLESIREGTAVLVTYAQVESYLRKKEQGGK